MFLKAWSFELNALFLDLCTLRFSRIFPGIILRQRETILRASLVALRLYSPRALPQLGAGRLALTSKYIIPLQPETIRFMEPHIPDRSPLILTSEMTALNAVKIVTQHQSFS